MRRPLSAALVALALALAACGGDDESDEEGVATSTPTAAETQTVPTTADEGATTAEDEGATTAEDEGATTPEAEGGSQPGDEDAVREVVVTWLLEGRCELMTDEFLEEQAFVGDDRRERCRFFERSFTRPQYTERDIRITDVRVSGDSASLVVGDDNTNITAKYALVREGGDWLIQSVDLQ